MKRLFSILLCLIILFVFTLQVFSLATVAVKGIALDKSGVTLDTGKTYDLKVTFTPSNTTQKILLFSTSNKNVATIDAKGKITAVRSGTATITVTSASNKMATAKCVVTVTKQYPDMSKRIKVSVIAWGQYPIENTKYIKAMGDKYNMDISVWPCYGDEFKNQVYTRLAAGEDFDLLKLSNGLEPTKLIDQDLLMEVPESFIMKYTPKWYADIAKYTDTPFKLSRFDGKNYGWPGTTADGDYGFTPVWRSDWLKNVGITKTPETILEFEEAFYKFTNNDPDKNGKKDTHGLSNIGMLPVFGAFGPLPFSNNIANPAEYYSLKNGKIVANAIQPEMKAALTVLRKWYKDGVIDPQFVTGERTEGHWSASQAFATGRIGFSAPGMFYNTGRTSEIGVDGRFYKLFRSTQDGLGITTSDYVIGRPPIGKDGKTSGTLRWGQNEPLGYCLSKTLEKNMEKAARIAMMLDDTWMNLDNYLTAEYGTKGIDWTYDPKTGVQSGLGPETKLAKENANWAKLGLGYQFLIDSATMQKAENPIWYPFADKVASYTKNYTDPIASVPLSMRDKYGADLDKKVVMTYIDIITGKQPIDNFDKFAAEWHTSGGDDILKEANMWWQLNGK